MTINLSDNEIIDLKLASLVGKIEAGELMPSYLDWLGDKQPELTLTWPHVKYIGDHIQQLIDGKIRKLMISLHPRIGKSTLVTQALPVYMIAKNRNHKTILAAYNQTLANKFSVKCRSFAERCNITLNPNKRARDEWEVDGYDGGVRSVGVGAGVAGYGANLIVIDDPIRSRKDANSPTIKQMIYDWYQSDIFTRLEKDASIVYIATRWAEDDLSGMILQSEGEYSEENPTGWLVINLPALAEENDLLGRLPGEALCPDRFNREQLLSIKAVLGPNFDALYQGRPVSELGGMFQRQWFKFFEYIPRDEYGHLQYYRFWDLASTIELTSDYTVGVLLAHSSKSKNVYIIDVQRFRKTTYERDQKILQTARKDRIEYGDVRIVFEKEPGSSGVDAAQAMIKLLAGFVVRAVASRKNKVLRAEPFSSYCESGLVYLKKADWNRDYIQELCLFDRGKHDDQVDASSGAFNEATSSKGFIRIGKAI